MAIASSKKRDATPSALAGVRSSRGRLPTDSHTPSTPSGDSLAFLTTIAGQRRVAKLLELGLNKYQRKLNRDFLEGLKIGFVGWLTANLKDTESRVGSVAQLRRENWLQGEIQKTQERQGSQVPRFVCDFLVFSLRQALQKLKHLKAVHKSFQRDVASATTVRDRREIILHFAAELGATANELEADEKAFSRWFDEEAVSDRFYRSIGECEMQVSFVLGRLAEATVHVFHRSIEFSAASKGGTPSDQVDRLSGIWGRLGIESVIFASLVYEGDSRIHVAAIGAMRVMLQSVPPNVAVQLLSQQMLNFIDRAARQRNSEVWIQCEAITILSTLLFPMAVTVMKQRLEKPGEGDDFFVRQHIWSLIGDRIRQFPDQSPGVAMVIDPSPFVRQAMATATFFSSVPQVHQHWCDSALTDPDPKVRASAMTVGMRKRLTPQHYLDFLRLLPRVLESEVDPFVLRAAAASAVVSTKCLLERSEALSGSDQSQASFTMETIVRKQIIPALLKIQEQHPSTAVRRWACQACEKIWAELDPEIRRLVEQLKPELRKIKVGHSQHFPSAWFSWIDDITLGRLFAVLSQDDFGYDIQRTFWGVRVSRGPSFGFRLWRFLFEVSRSATDKRQAHRHTVGRISTATLRAPSQITGELSQTKVPGEPLVIGDDGTWRPFLPLADDFISLINMSWLKPRTVSFVSAQGVTRVTAPPTLGQRIKACWRLTVGLPAYAEPRNLEGDEVKSRKYLASFEELGFKVDFQSHRYRRSCLAVNGADADHEEISCLDDSVTRFFSEAAAVTWMVPFLTQAVGASLTERVIGFFNRFTIYFSSLFENSLEELVLFAGVVFALVIARHGWTNYRFRKSRQRIAMSIGGWGTRGKSGTERLKAALMNVLGYSLVSKTTGCEAMFIHSFAFGEPLEIPLFRPYDKATIWEQKHLVNMAAKMKSSVFLWECMALNPNYVDVLQNQWMIDDLATITNTYPDHEDIQGPAGYNVAETISGFVPPKSTLVTTEEQMLPYVRQKCSQHDTELQSVGWLESGLITEDILARFPYQEHPDNIALVARMAENLGVSQPQSFKAMADELVPDLGVLKTHPVALVRNRRIEFTNGMSANERFGCMGNWKRLGYAQQNHLEEPTTWICGVVNNRADRVPRSKVFASILVNDISADRFFLIGSNLNGLRKFIAECWQEKEAGLSLKTSDGQWDVQHAKSVLRQSAIDARQPLSRHDIAVRLKAMLESLLSNCGSEINESKLDEMVGAVATPEQLTHALEELPIEKTDADAVIGHFRLLSRGVAEYVELFEIIEDAPELIADTVNEKFQLAMRKWFERKIVVVPDVEATGEEVITRIVDEVPPGFVARVMGLQNIKGTGLDFVYRFHAWDVCHEACEATGSRDTAAAEKAIQTLSAMPVIGQLCVEKLKRTVEQCRNNKNLQRADLQLKLDQLESRLKTATDTWESTSGSTTAEAAIETTSSGMLGRVRSELNDWAVEWAEQFLDVNDSIRRREKSEQIYRDLVAGRIGRQRSVIELRKLNKRQKGGWLKEDSRKVKDLVSKKVGISRP